MQATESFIKKNGWNREKERLKLNCYVAGKEIDYTWTPREKQIFKQLYNDGRTLSEVSRYLKRSQADVLVLALDLNEKGQLKPRKTVFFA
ncbi:hypothetical protein [Shouchella tritolerans]|uniref:hypothetical protein n=1 Tax=Shouchella tritolerans TaxID=2979466 RepID=UPI0021E81799|nr:hypothetical protein [Shouchella tritolerans]